MHCAAKPLPHCAASAALRAIGTLRGVSHIAPRSGIDKMDLISISIRRRRPYKNGLLFYFTFKTYFPNCGLVFINAKASFPSFKLKT